MPQYTIVPHADRSPGGCFVCGEHAGPFLDLAISNVQFNTPDGPLRTHAGVYICIGSPESPGCAVQLGRATGMLDDPGEVRHYREAAERLAIENVQLRYDLEASEQKAAMKGRDVEERMRAAMRPAQRPVLVAPGTSVEEGEPEQGIFSRRLRRERKQEE